MSTTTSVTVDALSDYYEAVLKNGSLLSAKQAFLWSRATLNMLGVNLDKKVKKQLGEALPEELREQLNGVFWLAFFRNSQMPAWEFQNRVARRAGNSDANFARLPITAVFAAIKQQIPADLSQTIHNDLAPEVAALWAKA